MARIGVMTFLHNGNVGSALQAWALQTVLTDLGHEVEDIDYRPSKAEKLRNLLRSGNSPALVLEGMRKRRAPSYGGANREHERFIRERLRLSPVCADRAALARHGTIRMTGRRDETRRSGNERNEVIPWRASAS